MSFDELPIQIRIVNVLVTLFTSVAAGFIANTFHPETFKWIDSIMGKFFVVFLIMWSILEFDMSFKKLLSVVYISVFLTIILYMLQKLSFYIFDKKVSTSTSTSTEEREKNKKKLR